MSMFLKTNSIKEVVVYKDFIHDTIFLSDRHFLYPQHLKVIMFTAMQ
jgi:hypothetical protein